MARSSEYCLSCGSRLASDHGGSRCSPCSRRQHTDDGPLAHPIDFWQRDSLRDALRTRHFGRVVHAYRLAHDPPIPQATVARWLDLTQAQISRMERSTVAPADLHKLQMWAAALRIPPAMLWFNASHTADASGVSEPSRNLASVDDVRRREMLKLTGATVVAGSGLVTNAPWERLAESLSGRRAADAPTVHAIERRTEQHFRIEDTEPARTRLPALRDHQQAIRGALDATTDSSLRRRLLTSLGETQALAGLAMFDVQRHDRAVRLYQEALRTAREAGDGPLIAYTLCVWTYLLSSRGEHAAAAEMLTEASEHVRGSSPATQAWVSGHRAERLASAGQATEALRSLDRAITLFDYAGVDRQRPWTYFITAGRMGGFAVGTYARLGHENTEELAEGLLNTLPTEEGKNRALILGELATSAAATGDYERVRSFALPAADFAVRTELTQAIDRLWDLADSVPATSASGRRVRDDIAERLLRGTPA